MTTTNLARIDADRELVHRMLDGDRRAFDEFADDYVPQLYRFTLRRVRDREVTVEVVQSTVCKAIDKLSGYRGEAALMTWLCAVCRNEIAAFYRDQGRRRMESDIEAVEEVIPVSPDGVGLGTSGIDGPEQSAMQNEQAELVHELLDGMPPRYARVLELKYIQELPVRDIAERLQLSAKATESMLTRARAAFRAVWGEHSVPIEGRRVSTDNEQAVAATTRGTQ